MASNPIRFVADAFPREFVGGTVGRVLISVINVNPLAGGSLVREDWFEFQLSGSWGAALGIAANVVVNSPSGSLSTNDLRLTLKGPVLRVDYVGQAPAVVQPGEGYGFALKLRVPGAFASGTLSVRGSQQLSRIDPITPPFIALASMPAPTSLPVGSAITLNNGSVTATGSTVTTQGGTVNSGAGTTVNVSDGATVVLPPGWQPPAALPVGPNFLQVAARRWYGAADLQRITLPAVAGALAFDGVNLWAAPNGGVGLMRIDVATGAARPVPLISTSQAAATVLPDPVNAMIFDGVKFWVCGNSHGLVVQPDGRVLSSVAPPAAPGCLLFDGHWIWAGESSSVVRVDASIPSALNGVPALSNLTGMIHDGGNVWMVASSGGAGQLARVSTRTLQMSASQTLDFGAAAIAFDGVHLWLADRDQGTIRRLKYDGAADICRPAGVFPSGTAPECLLFDGSNIWVTNEISGDVTQLRAADGFRLGNWPVGASPRTLAFDGINLWLGLGQIPVLRRL